MRLFFATVLLIFLFACNPDERKSQNKVIPPGRLKAIIDQSHKRPANTVSEAAGSQSRSAIRRHSIHKKKGRPETIVIVTTYRQTDSVRLKTIEQLRTGEFRPDFSEPLNTELLKKLGDSAFQSAITLSPDRVLKIGFDNDIFDYTDQFFTNGISFEYVAPALSDNPVKYILLPYWGKARNYYGLSLIQNLYTPSTTKVGGILYGDRPYASYLYFGSFKVTNDETHHFRQVSELGLGVIGPPSLGGTVQDLFHKYVPYNNEPLGWEYQISTDAVINYTVSLSKGIINTAHTQLILSGNAALGTLYTNLGGGFNLRLGWFNDFFSDLGVRKKRVLIARGARVMQYFFSLKGSGRVIGYDATLQGGLINSNSVYTIPSASIIRLVSQSSLGFTFTCGAVGIEIEQIVLSPEFSNNWWHAWGHIGLLFAL
ncbi:MAG: lipid A deacylase LpxR family protein [Bacteroidota bacterium]